MAASEVAQVWLDYRHVRTELLAGFSHLPDQTTLSVRVSRQGLVFVCEECRTELAVGWAAMLQQLGARLYALYFPPFCFSQGCRQTARARPSPHPTPPTRWGRGALEPSVLPFLAEEGAASTIRSQINQERFCERFEAALNRVKERFAACLCMSALAQLCGVPS